MKIFTFILSVISLIATFLFIVAFFPDLSTANGIILFSMLVILLLICITGIILNIPAGSRTHGRYRVIK